MNTNHTFSDLGLPASLLEAIAELGFEEPSAIQKATIPVAMTGCDLVGLSETGSGKTAAFGLPALSLIDLDQSHPQMLVLCPTRELAVQVCDEINRLGCKMPKLKTVAIYGGAPITRQIRALNQGTQVVVGTPGRLIDHIERGSLELDKVKTVILDEADRMLDMGFLDEMESLLRAVPKERQTLFFSATMNQQVERLIQKFSSDPKTIEIERKTLTVDSIEQVAYQVRQRSKVEVVSRILDLEQPRLAIVFCNTKRAVDECTEALLARGYSADRLHGDITQMLRERVLRMFREGTVEVLVATDVAARGIDVENIDIVFNYDLPQDPEDYVHRIGRTGRAGRSGKAVSFMFGRDVYRLQTIERYTRQTIQRAAVPSIEEVKGRLESQLIDQIKERLDNKDYTDTSDDLKILTDQGFPVENIANVALSLLRESISRDSEEIIEDRDDIDFSKEPRGKDRQNKRRDRDRKRTDRKDGETEAGMTRLFLNLGKAQRVRPGDIVGMMHNELGIPRDALGRISMAPGFTLVEIAEEHAASAIAESKQSKLRGKKFILDYDRASGSEGGGGKGKGKPKGGDRGRPPRDRDRDRDRKPRGDRKSRDGKGKGNYSKSKKRYPKK